MTYPYSDLVVTRANTTPLPDNHPGDHNAEGAALNDLKAELGAGPKGGSADLTARLAALDISVGGKQPADADLTAIAALTGTGWARRSAENTWTLDSTIPWGSIATTPTTLAGYGISDAQQSDADLTAIAALTGTGWLQRTGESTWALGNPSNPPGGSDTQLQYNNSSAFGGTAGLTWNATTKTLALARGVLTAASAGLSLAETWNNVAVTFGAFEIDATDTASAAGSLLESLKVGGTPKWSVRKDGQLTVGNVPWGRLSSVPSTLSGYGITSLDLTGASASTVLLNFDVTSDTQDRLQIQADGKLLWGSGSATTDTNLYRSAANTLKTDDKFLIADTTAATADDTGALQIAGGFSARENCCISANLLAHHLIAGLDTGSLRFNQGTDGKYIVNGGTARIDLSTDGGQSRLQTNIWKVGTAGGSPTGLQLLFDSYWSSQHNSFITQAYHFEASASFSVNGPYLYGTGSSLKMQTNTYEDAGSGGNQKYATTNPIAALNLSSGFTTTMYTFQHWVSKTAGDFVSGSPDVQATLTLTPGGGSGCGFDLPYGHGYYVNSVQVVGAQQSAITDPNDPTGTATSSGYGFTDQTEFETFVSDVAGIADAVQSILSAMRTHGLIAT